MCMHKYKLLIILFKTIHNESTEVQNARRWISPCMHIVPYIHAIYADDHLPNLNPRK